MAINTEKSKVEKYTIVSINFTHPLSSNKVETNITISMYMNEFNSNERIKTFSCTHFHCKLRCLDIENGVIHFTTALNELLVTKNIKEFYVNDMCIDINANTIQNTESLNVKNC